MTEPEGGDGTDTNEGRTAGKATGEDGAPVVLIVEDERSLADLYAAYLEDDYAVRIAYTGEEALEALDADVDVALLDRKLPEWSGDELLTVIQDRNIDCQIAMVTAVVPDFDIVDMAIDDYLTKPVSREDLRETVEELLVWTESTIDGQELLALLSRKQVLQREKSEAELERSRQYAKLERRIELAQGRLETKARHIGSKYRPDECSQCGIRWDLSVDGTVGFVQLGSFIWKCTRCGNVQEQSPPSNRRVARR